MTRIDATWTPSEREVAEFNTCATDEATLTSNEISGRDGWDHVIDAKLIEWERILKHWWMKTLNRLRLRQLRRLAKWQAACVTNHCRFPHPLCQTGKAVSRSNMMRPPFFQPSRLKPMVLLSFEPLRTVYLSCGGSFLVSNRTINTGMPMSAADGSEPLDDDELIYRRILAKAGHFNPDSRRLSPEAFRPGKHDETGISVDRNKYRTLEEAAHGRNENGYYVAVLCVGDLRREGLDVVPKPTLDNSGHAEIPALNYCERRSDQVQQWKVLLAHKLTRRVEGPFGQNQS